MPLYRGSRRLILVRKPVVVAAPAFTSIINFRATSGYVTDGANQTYCLASADAFPTSRGGQTFGWDAFCSAADRDSALDPRLAGINFVTGSGTTIFKFTLPRTGVFNVNYAAGDAGGFSKSMGIVIKDNTTAVNTSATLNTSGTQFADISGTIRATPAAWIASASAAAVALTFATTSFSLELSGIAGGSGSIANLTITG